MRLKLSSLFVLTATAAMFLSAGPVCFAQAPSTSIQLFSPVVVRFSDAGAGYGASIDNFNTTTLNLSCPAAPAGTLSSTPDGTGYLLVDNNIDVTLIAGGKTSAPVNICLGGVDTSPVGPFENCFTQTYENEANTGSLTGQDPDSFVSTGGVPPIDISKELVSGLIQLKVVLQDEGGYLTNSNLYLTTNCTQTGVTGPAFISGNPISSSSPTAGELSQNFSFSSTFGQQIGFQYDLTAAESAGTLSIMNQTIPEVADQPLDPAIYQSTYVPGTSFATSSCLIHSGELLPSGAPACKLYTLDCKVGTDATATGAQCPISSLPNELFQDLFDGPTFTLTDIQTPSGPTFHEGIGLLMAKEGWTGGPCAFDPSAGLDTLDCPQNLLTSFTSTEATIASFRGRTSKDSSRSGASRIGNASSLQVAGAKADIVVRPAAASAATAVSYSNTGRTTHPNSTFLSIAGIPEDLTTVSVAGQHPGYWINKPTAVITLSSQPPNLAGTSLPGATTFVPSPIESITYGLSTAATLPNPGDLPAAGTPLLNTDGCPSPSSPGTPAASVFTPGERTLSGLADGKYLIYYYAQDCAGTEELKFTQDGGGYWSTSFYTYPLNVDTTAPVIASGPTLSPAPTSGGYALGQPVTASYSCTDSLSGIAACGSQTYATPTGSTGTLTSPVDTSSPGSKTYTVVAIDAAGNQTMMSVRYQVVGSYDSMIKLTPQTELITYPQSTLATVTVLPSVASLHHTPKGTVQLQDASNAFATLATLMVQGNGTGNGVASFYVPGLSAGIHSLVAKYSGDTYNSAGISVPVTLTVQPQAVKLTVSCSAATLTSGNSDTCKVYTTPILAGSNASITYQLDSNAPVAVPLSSGATSFTIPTPATGPHTIVIAYAAQGNYAAAPSQTVGFTVTAK